jgi:hypothetical protein
MHIDVGNCSGPNVSVAGEHRMVQQGEKDTHFKLRIKQFFIFSTLFKLLEEVGTPGAGALKGLPTPPFIDFMMVASQQNSGHIPATKRAWASVMRVFK